jgi:Tol biopolymer transport system component
MSGPANAKSSFGSISADGRYVAFQSDATNLVAGDTNGVGDVFTRDRITGVTVRISVSSSGTQSNGYSAISGVSANGRFVTMDSDATNLVVGDLNNWRDVFVHDVLTGSTKLVSVSTSGTQANGLSAISSVSDDGRFVVFQSDAPNLVSGDANGNFDIFLRDLLALTTTCVSRSTAGVPSNGSSQTCDITPDGRFVGFASTGSNIVVGDTNNAFDVFVLDRPTNIIERVSVATGGAQGGANSYAPSLSADGRFVAFYSVASNLVAGDTNGLGDAFVRDRQLGTTVRVNLTSAGAQVFDQTDGPLMCRNGRFVAFDCYATNLVPGDTNGYADVFVHDLLTGGTERVSLSTSGGQSNEACLLTGASSDGRFIAFYPGGSNLVAGDTNGTNDVFVRDRGAAAPMSYCQSQANSLSCVPAMSFTGTPSASSPSPFTLGATQIISHRAGLLFYGLAPTSTAYLGGTLCVHAPVRRTPTQDSLGNPPPPSDCSGSYAYDMNARIQSGVDPGLVVGAEVFTQYWSRDPAAPSTTNLTNAVTFKIEP